MKNIKAVILSVVFACISLTSCSTNDKNIDVDKIVTPSEASVSIELIENKESIENNDEDEFDFVVWNNAIIEQYLENAVLSRYPKANLKIVSFDGPDYEKVTKALAANEPIDMITYYREGFGNFNSLDGFEDLLKPDYDFNSIKSIFNERELEHCKSFDDSKLLALPFPEFPMVTFYRADILEKYGFPTDPEELGNYISTLEGWMKIATELQKDGIHVLQWNEEIFQQALRNYGFYDDNMNLIVNNEKVRESLKLTIQAHRQSLASKVNVWGPDGQKLIKEDKIAMMYINKWGESHLQGFAPEQAGKWRATRLPLDIYGYQSSYYGSIPSTSKHKKQAWDILKTYLVNDYKSITIQIDKQSEYLGGQKSMQLYDELINKIPLRYPTMLDNNNFSIFMDILYNNMDNKSADDIFNLSISKINESTYHEQKVLTEYLNEHRKK
ncbi:extracellular solute-binding protein [Ruminiclostridium herbifermentans]|uniref:Extracellular solute-binding protein n=1 Tax=Ruminiclostridium herbifermentans TaxID=2488810 RepID=A0A4U7JDS5_9FIRM|nr:extracellular solute-binding protein [Ruminiclostridium herbifermentans]QNU65788.1 extracellular solute-binding protein [Ruminiclostridium herbifermentans]